MRTKKEVEFEFTPNQKLDETQKQCIYKLQLAFLECANEILDLCPDNPSRVSALKKLLDAKFTATQSITHHKEK